MSTPAALRTAAWVPVVGVVLFFKDDFPALVSLFPGFIKHVVLDFNSAVHELLTFIWSDYSLLFLAIVFLRYFRLVVNLYAYLILDEPDQIPEHPTITSDLAHVIIPSVEPTNDDFLRCVQSVLEKRPGWITIVTANSKQTADAEAVVASLPPQTHTVISVTTGPMANKRHQLAHVLRRLAQHRKENEDVLVVFVDDHVWWPSARFLEAALAPFENPKTGIVAMHKRPERARGNQFKDNLLNFIACLYLERHNFEVCSSNAIDGSAFVVSGRTSVIRATIAMEDDFINGFVDEHFFFGMFGPLNPDDDNYITRYIIRKGWNIKWQSQPEALMETSLGVSGGYAKFWGQIKRWARSQWRSNPCSVFTDRSIWTRGYFWGGFTHLVSFFNFALVWDALIVYFWYHSHYDSFRWFHVALMVLGSKMVKIAPFFWRNPCDLWLFPFQVLFAYLHSFIKLWALLTFWNHSWSGRNLKAIEAEAANSDDGDDGSSNNSGGRNDRDAHNNRDNSSVDGVDDNDDDSDDDDSDSDDGGDGHRSSARQLPSSSLMRTQHLGANRPASTVPFGNGFGGKYQKYQLPANVREGQYTPGIETAYGTPRGIRNYSGPCDGVTRDFPVVSGTAATATVKGTRGRALSRVGEIPQTPRRNNGGYSLHTHDADTGCYHPTNAVNGPRTHYYPRVPDAPRKQSIVFTKTPPMSSVNGPVPRLNLLRDPMKNTSKLVYIRDFPRGDDCNRTHPDGTYLGARRPSSGKRRCRSPEPSIYARVSGRSRI